MPLQQTSGNATVDAYSSNGVLPVRTYIEDVFSTYLYTGNGSTQTITNGIDLTGKGGLVWLKNRGVATGHALLDTLRGPGTSNAATNMLSSESTNGTGGSQAGGNNDYLNAFTSSGFSVTYGGSGVLGRSFTNTTSNNYVSWTFRKQPKFFDVVTYTGNGANRTIAHNLGSAPRFMLVKRTDTTGNWCAYHSDLGATQIMFLNTTAAAATNTTYWNSTNPNATVFSVGTNAAVNASGGSYVAYLFASDAGGFGLTGTDNVISCGSLTTAADGSASVTLGYEPQWILLKQTNAADDWVIVDNMRGMPVDGATGNDRVLWPNLSNAEDKHAYFDPTATGFTLPAGGWLAGSGTFIYIAIRRGPMRVPRDATTVFTPVAWTGTGSVTNMSTGSLTVPDLFYSLDRTGTFNDWYFVDRLRGGSKGLRTPATTAEGTFSASAQIGLDVMNNITLPTSQVFNNTGTGYANYAFGRAPGFFDEVCFSTPATVSAPITQNHNLGVAPELVITKRRNSTSQWFTVCSYGMTASQYVAIESTAQRVAYGGGGTSTWSADATTVTLPSGYFYTSSDYVYYLFASCPGVSKVGSYTGNGSTQTINCGFTGGARFVLIKRTDSTGGWYVYDTARGMTTLTDPYLFLNSTAAEAATLGSVTTVTTGFAVDASILAAVNTNAATYIFLAIA